MGNPDRGGRYFTIWSPGQCGKTWLMRQTKLEMEREDGDRFMADMMSMQGVVPNDADSPDELLPWFSDLLKDAVGMRPEPPGDWQGRPTSCPKGATYPSTGLSSHRLGYLGALLEEETFPKGVEYDGVPDVFVCFPLVEMVMDIPWRR